MRTNRKWLLISLLILVVVTIGILLFVWYKSARDSGLVTPEKVSLYLETSVENGEKIPILVLSTVTGGGCDSASDLQTKETFSGNELLVEILGYNFTKGSGEVCPAVILESQTKVKLASNWLKDNGEKEIVFKLKGKENIYKLSYSQYQVTLTRVQATNVISSDRGKNIPSTSETLRTTLYPNDVAILYLSGSVDSEKDYRVALSKFAQEKGFIPAEQIYPTLLQTKKNWLYVVIKSRSIPEPNSSESLGKLPNEGVDVNLRAISDIDS
ncbi:MAG: hypothetical protein Q7S37_04045 [bacterium]|nr:hypothetical protein [bacterium]